MIKQPQKVGDVPGSSQVDPMNFVGIPGIQ